MYKSCLSIHLTEYTYLVHFKYQKVFLRTMFNFNRISLLIFIALIQMLPKISLAQESTSPELTEGDFFNDFPIVLTATRIKQSKNNSPTSSTIIDRAMIEASGFNEIADLLRLAPGMLVNYESGNVPAVGYQFLYDQYRVRLQIMVDGMSVYTPLFGEMPWTQLGITIDDIDRIEVIRGPSSASYGPNAMTGVISIITRHAALDKGVRFKIKQGENGRSEQYVTIGDSQGNFDYRLSVGKRKDAGFKERYDDKNLLIANFRGDYQATNKDSITLGFNNNTGDYQKDAVDYFDPVMPDHLRNVEQTSFQSKWVHSFSDGDSFALNYYYQYYVDNNSYHGDYGEPFNVVFVNDSVKTKRNNLEFSYSASSDWYRLNLGALYRKDKTTAPQLLYNVDKEIVTKQLFTNVELHLNENNILNVGLLRDENDTGGSTLAPRFALNHHISNNHTARISYSESTRSPFAFEEYTNRVIPNKVVGYEYKPYWLDLSDLKPEKIKSYDMGYVGKLNNNATEIDLRLYKSFLTDLIVFDSKKFKGGFKQGDEFEIDGFEATMSHKFKDTKIILNYARANISAGNLIFADASDLETGTPKNSGSLLFMHDFNQKLKASLGYYHTGEYQQLCCESQQQSPRNRVDLTLSNSFKWLGYKSKIKFVLQNALNEKTETLYLNNYHRQGYISLGMEL